MTRYNEIMDHIVVTDEMRERILTNIDRQTWRAGARKTRPATTWIPVLAAAAILFVVCSVALNIDRGNQSTSSQIPETELAAATETAADTEAAVELAESADAADVAKGVKESTDGLEEAADTTDAVSESSADMVAASYWADEYDSAKALSEAVGFEITDLTSISFAPAQTTYMAIGGDLAQISYYDAEGNELTYRKSTGTEDNSGDYNVYNTEETLTVNGQNVTLKGDGSLVNLAVWTDETYAYSIYVSGGCSHEAMQSMIVETQ